MADNRDVEEDAYAYELDNDKNGCTTICTKIDGSGNPYDDSPLNENSLM